LLTAPYVLTGLRLNRNQLRTLYKGVRAVRESEAYQAILDEGRVENAQQMLLRQGRKKFGEPEEATREALLGINDRSRLEELSERLSEVNTWQELLGTP